MKIFYVTECEQLLTLRKTSCVDDFSIIQAALYKIKKYI